MRTLEQLLHPSTQPEDLAAALATVSDEWFFKFLLQLRNRSAGRAFAVASFLQRNGVESTPAELGDFGYDPEDSKRLLELREAIEQHLGWSSDKDRERGDYVARVRQIGMARRATSDYYTEGPIGERPRDCLNCGLQYRAHTGDGYHSMRCPDIDVERIEKLVDSLPPKPGKAQKLATYILDWLESRNGAELEPALEGMTVGDQRRLLEELTLILEHGGKPPNWIGASQSAPSYYAAGGREGCVTCGRPYAEHITSDECDSPRCPEPK